MVVLGVCVLVFFVQFNFKFSFISVKTHFLNLEVQGTNFTCFLLKPVVGFLEMLDQLFLSDLRNRATNSSV